MRRARDRSGESVWRAGRACMPEGVRTSTAVRGVSSRPTSEAACLASPFKFQDQSPKPVSSTLKSTKLGRELRRDGDSRPAIVSGLACGNNAELAGLEK